MERMLFGGGAFEDYFGDLTIGADLPPEMEGLPQEEVEKKLLQAQIGNFCGLLFVHIH
jgi:hypothetical protein